MSVNEQMGLRGHRVRDPEQATARRRDILVAAAQVFGQAGSENATLVDVAAKMGVSRGVIYYYFRSKEELITEVISTVIREANERLNAIVARGDPPDVTLRAILSDLAAHVFTDLDRYASLAGGPAVDRGTPSVVATHNLRHEYRTCVRAVITDGIRCGAFIDLDPGIMSLSVIQTALSIARWYRPEGGLPPETIVEQTVELAMRSVLRHPSPQDTTDGHGPDM